MVKHGSVAPPLLDREQCLILTWTGNSGPSPSWTENSASSLLTSGGREELPLHPASLQEVGNCAPSPPGGREQSPSLIEVGSSARSGRSGTVPPPLLAGTKFWCGWCGTAPLAGLSHQIAPFTKNRTANKNSHHATPLLQNLLKPHRHNKS